MSREDETSARRNRLSADATPELCPIQYIPLGRRVKDWNSPRSGASRRIVNAAVQSRIFLDFLQSLRDRDQKFKPCEAQVIIKCRHHCILKGGPSGLELIFELNFKVFLDLMYQPVYFLWPFCLKHCLQQHESLFSAKATYAAIGKTYSYLTPDLWKETLFQKSPYQEYSEYLGKNHRPVGVQKQESKQYWGGGEDGVGTVTLAESLNGKYSSNYVFHLLVQGGQT